MKSRALSIWYHFTTVTLLLGTLHAKAANGPLFTTWAACTGISCAAIQAADALYYDSYDDIRKAYGNASCNPTGSSMWYNNANNLELTCTNGVTPYHGCEVTSLYGGNAAANGPGVVCDQIGGDHIWVWCDSGNPNLVQSDGFAYLTCLPAGK